METLEAIDHIHYSPGKAPSSSGVLHKCVCVCVCVCVCDARVSTASTRLESPKCPHVDLRAALVYEHVRG